MPETSNTPSSIRTPTVFALHALGSSRREFDGIAAALGDRFEVVGIDLPGFGDATTSVGVTVDDMARMVVRSIKKHGSTRFVLVGHSMGGKVASVVASRILDGSSAVFGLAGVVLLAASPPSPEPMDEARRREMLGWASGGQRLEVDAVRPDGATPTDAGLDADAARTFVDANVGAPLDHDADELAIADVRRTSREAWIAWLERGSREDWTAAVGTLDLPALVVAGGDDGDLGEDAQRRLNAPVYPRAEVVVLDGAGHLLPLERPEAVAALIMSFWNESAGLGPSLPTDFAKTIASSRTSARTRSILARRALADDPDYRPRVLTTAQLATLRLVAERVVPQDGLDATNENSKRPGSRGASADAIDLAARVDAQLAAGAGDGWRNAVSPPDGDAYRLSLDALADFGDLDVDSQKARLSTIAEGRFDDPNGVLTAEQLAAWFEDARVDLVRQWLAHPATMNRIGYDGFANGGDGLRLQGFQLLGANEREGWEPALVPATTKGLPQ